MTATDPTDGRVRIAPPDVTLVTGATGWLGTGVMHALSGDGPYARAGTIRGLVHGDAGGPPVAATAAGEAHVEYVPGDITDPASLETFFAGLPADGTVDLIHTAGIIHPAGRTDEFDLVNHVGTRNVLDAARAAGVRRVVHVSSNSPFGTNGARDDTFRNEEPYHPYLGYGRSKMDAELVVFEAVEAGLDAVLVRPPWFYGPHQPARQTTFFTMVRTGRFPILGDGGQRRSMTYIDNLVQGTVLAELVVTDPGRGWWIADAEPYTVRQIVDTVGEALRAEGFEVKANRFRLPEFAGTVAERIDTVIQRADRYHQEFHVLGEMNKTIAVDISAARSELGYDPQVALLEGMRRSIRWCIENGLEL